jgi:hypothetical protein
MTGPVRSVAGVGELEGISSKVNGCGPRYEAGPRTLKRREQPSRPPAVSGPYCSRYSDDHLDLKLIARRIQRLHANRRDTRLAAVERLAKWRERLLKAIGRCVPT